MKAKTVRQILTLALCLMLCLTVTQIVFAEANQEEESSIIDVVISPDIITIRKGSVQQFTATVSGTGSFSDEVIWSITGGNYGTNISSEGLLAVADYNTEDILTITATSVADPGKSGTATVTLVPFQSYNVSFEMNGHGTAVNTQSVYEKYKVERPEDPLDEEWIFGGWYRNEECTKKFDFDEPITSDTTVYAKWISPKYAVFINCGTASLSEAEAGTIVTITADIAPEGKHFDSWSIASAPAGFELDDKYSASTSFTMPCEDIIIAAIYAVNEEPVRYTVSFELNGHGNQVEAQTVNAGEKAIKPENPEAEGFTFGGWYRDETFTEAFDFDALITSDTTVYAKWTKDLIKITKIEITAPTPVAGKTRAETETTPVITTVPENAVTVSDGDWWDVSGSYFTGTFEASETYSFGVNIAPKEGYKLECSGDDYLGEIVVNGGTFAYTESDGRIVFLDVNVECSEAAPESYAVSFELNGHGKQVEAQTVNAGEKAIKPENPEAESFTFGGWYRDETLTEAFDFETGITSDVTVYAKWTKSESPVTPEKSNNTVLLVLILVVAVLGCAVAALLLIRKKRKG